MGNPPPLDPCRCVCPTYESISLCLCVLPGIGFTFNISMLRPELIHQTYRKPATLVDCFGWTSQYLFDNTLAAASSSIYTQNFFSRNGMPLLIRNSRGFFGHPSGHIPLFETKHSTASETPWSLTAAESKLRAASIPQ